jgi:succinate dehydrogenase / fumarate reductase cytochrome b subunit
MNQYLQGFKTHVGLKFLVALTGAMLVIFVIAHMLGNLQIYLGPNAINSYAENLQSMPGLLWTARLGLLAAFIVHIWGIAKLTLDNREARQAAYAEKQSRKATLASRTMVLSGLVLLAFVVYHLAHLTFGIIHPENFHLRDPLGRHDVYSMMVLGFREPLVSIPYLIAMGLLGMHLAHGAASIFQSMGWTRPRFFPLISAAGYVLALIIVIGNISIPLSCWLGVIEPTQGVL